MLSHTQMITVAQMRKLWVSAKQLELGDAELHQVAKDVTGKESLRALSCEEAARVIDRLVAAGADPTREARPKEAHQPPVPSNMIELATDKQIGMIQRLLYHLGWGNEDPYFRGCVQRAIGRDSIRTKPEASIVINMLREKVKEHGIEDQVEPSHRKHGA